MRLIVLIGIVCLIYITLVSAYTADNYWEVELVLSGDAYTADNYWEVELVLGEAEAPVDSCDCPGLNQNWEANMEDACIINDNCNLGTGKLNHTGDYGNFTCNATISTSDRDVAPNNTTFYWDSNCLINLSSS